MFDALTLFKRRWRYAFGGGFDDQPRTRTVWSVAKLKIRTQVLDTVRTYLIGLCTFSEWLVLSQITVVGGNCDVSSRLSGGEDRSLDYPTLLFFERTQLL